MSATRRNTFPLYAKILLWFFLNLIALGVGSYALLHLQFHIGPELLLVGNAGERLRAVTDVIRDELNSRPREEWDMILERFSKAHHVKFMLYLNEGVPVAGKAEPLPPKVHRRLVERPERRGPGQENRRGEGLDVRRPPEAGNPRPEGGEPGPGRPGPDQRRFPSPFPGEERGQRRPPRPQNRQPFVVQTEKPAGYWIGLPLPLAEGVVEAVGPTSLLIFTDSLRAGGLLLDYWLWIWVGAGAVAFSVVFWLPLVRSITGSVRELTEATSRIAEGKFDTRVDARRRDELGRLGGAVNQMAERLEGFVSGQKRFLGDTAHELCSPIARMQMAVGILEERAGERERPYVADLREEVQEISNLVNELLSFSKASLGASTLKLQQTALLPVAQKAVHREAEEGVEVKLEIAPEISVVADPELLVRAVSNLLRNAVRYAGQAGPITISAGRVGEEVELKVSDQGPGAPEAELPKLFDPFYRPDVSRNRATGGVGLGLSIVKTCVESCGGTVSCRNRDPRGFEVVIRLQRGA